MQYNFKFSIFYILLIPLFIVFSCNEANRSTFYKNGMVSSAHPIASKIGIDILKQGGNAFDARLMEENIQVRIIDKESILSDHRLSRGSVAVLQMDNPNYQDLSSRISQIGSDLGISIVSIESGFGPELLPDWGGRHFRLLEKPQVAILGHSSFNSYDVGVSWWSLDHHLGIRHSLLNGSFAGYADLRRYNEIIMPSGYLEKR